MLDELVVAEVTFRLLGQPLVLAAVHAWLDEHPRVNYSSRWVPPLRPGDLPAEITIYVGPSMMLPLADLLGEIDSTQRRGALLRGAPPDICGELHINAAAATSIDESSSTDGCA